MVNSDQTSLLNCGGFFSSIQALRCTRRSPHTWDLLDLSSISNAIRGFFFVFHWQQEFVPSSSHHGRRFGGNPTCCLNVSFIPTLAQLVISFNCCFACVTLRVRWSLDVHPVNVKCYPSVIYLSLSVLYPSVNMVVTAFVHDGFSHGFGGGSQLLVSNKMILYFPIVTAHILAVFPILNVLPSSSRRIL